MGTGDVTSTPPIPFCQLNNTPFYLSEWLFSANNCKIAAVRRKTCLIPGEVIMQIHNPYTNSSEEGQQDIN